MLLKNNTRFKLLTEGDRDREEHVRCVSDNSISAHKLTNKLYFI